METEPSFQSQWRGRVLVLAKLESYTIHLYSMVYCLSLFCHRTGVMSMVSEYAHGNWLLL